jgi:hypothetical protein
MRFELKGETRVLSYGDGVLIEPDALHSAVVLDLPCRTLDAWHPIGEDYR